MAFAKKKLSSNSHKCGQFLTFPHFLVCSSLVSVFFRVFLTGFFIRVIITAQFPS
jgi:hypothetical protein